MAINLDLESFRIAPKWAGGVEGKRVLITGAGRGLGRAFAVAAGLNKAESVGVHYHSSYADGLETVEAINQAGGNAFPVQADVTNTSDIWSTRSYVIRKMGNKPPNLLICNSGLSERGYLLGMPPKAVEGEAAAMRRSRARNAFVSNLHDSRAVLATKIEGFLYLTHLWAGEAMHFNEKLQIVYVSSRQATDPGAGVPGYVLANFGVLALPRILRTNLGKRADLVRAFSVALPFVRTGMTEAYAENAKVFGRWQPRMLSSREAAHAVLQLLSRPEDELDDKVYQLNMVKGGEGETPIKVTWSEIQLQPNESQLGWSQTDAMLLPEKPGERE